MSLVYNTLKCGVFVLVHTCVCTKNWKQYITINIAVPGFHYVVMEKETDFDYPRTSCLSSLFVKHSSKKI